MTDLEVMEAVKCCNGRPCEECPIAQHMNPMNPHSQFPDCVCELLKMADKLIDKQKAQIKKLKNDAAETELRICKMKRWVNAWR